MVIAIDGPAASGKGTLARRLAGHFHFAYLDTGLLYRAVAARVLGLGGGVDMSAAIEAAKTLSGDDLVIPGLRSEGIAGMASAVAAVPEVRSALLDFQRAFAKAPPGGEKGAVLDGRDIGTTVCPDAEVKFFVSASLAVRAERRLKELRDRGCDAIEGEVLRSLKERDDRDSLRSVAPLVRAAEAIVIETSELSAEQVFDVAVREVAAVLALRG